jgi:hypothetical protein
MVEAGKSITLIALRHKRTVAAVRTRLSVLKVSIRRVKRSKRSEGKGEMTKPPFIVSRPWTPEEEDQLRTLAISGESIAAISKRLWRSEGALRHRARALGIVLRRVEKKE